MLLSDELKARAEDVLCDNVVSPVSLTSDMTREERRAAFLAAIGKSPEDAPGVSDAFTAHTPED